MEYDDLAKIDNLAHNLWDAAALFCLEHKSLRYTELGREMAAWSGRYLSESELTRTRHRLVRRKMISPGPGANGHNVYTITEAGRVRLAQIRVIIQIVPRLDQPDGHTADDDEKPADIEKAEDDGKPDDEG